MLMMLWGRWSVWWQMLAVRHGLFARCGVHMPATCSVLCLRWNRLHLHHGRCIATTLAAGG